MLVDSYAVVAGEHGCSYNDDNNTERDNDHSIKKQHRMVEILTYDSLGHCGLSCVDTMFEIIHCEKHPCRRRSVDFFCDIKFQ